MKKEKKPLGFAFGGSVPLSGSSNLHYKPDANGVWSPVQNPSAGYLPPPSQFAGRRTTRWDADMAAAAVSPYAPTPTNYERRGPNYFSATFGGYANGGQVTNRLPYIPGVPRSFDEYMQSLQFGQDKYKFNQTRDFEAAKAKNDYALQQAKLAQEVKRAAMEQELSKSQYDQTLGFDKFKAQNDYALQQAKLAQEANRSNQDSLLSRDKFLLEKANADAQRSWMNQEKARDFARVANRKPTMLGFAGGGTVDGYVQGLFDTGDPEFFSGLYKDAQGLRSQQLSDQLAQNNFQLQKANSTFNNKLAQDTFNRDLSKDRYSNTASMLDNQLKQGQLDQLSRFTQGGGGSAYDYGAAFKDNQAKALEQQRYNQGFKNQNDQFNASLGSQFGIAKMGDDTNRLKIGNDFSLGQGQLALGNKTADNELALGKGQLALGNKTADYTNQYNQGQLALGNRGAALNEGKFNFKKDWFGNASKSLLGFSKGGKSPAEEHPVAPSDTVPAMLTPNEFVLSVPAVKEIGLKSLEQFNKEALARSQGKNVDSGAGDKVKAALNQATNQSIQGFARGGETQSPVPFESETSGTMGIHSAQEGDLRRQMKEFSKNLVARYSHLYNQTDPDGTSYGPIRDPDMGIYLPGKNEYADAMRKEYNDHFASLQQAQANAAKASVAKPVNRNIDLTGREVISTRVGQNPMQYAGYANGGEVESPFADSLGWLMEHTIGGPSDSENDEEIAVAKAAYKPKKTKYKGLFGEAADAVSGVAEAGGRKLAQKFDDKINPPDESALNRKIDKGTHILNQQQNAIMGDANGAPLKPPADNGDRHFGPDLPAPGSGVTPQTLGKDGQPLNLNNVGQGQGFQKSEHATYNVDNGRIRRFDPDGTEVYMPNNTFTSGMNWTGRGHDRDLHIGELMNQGPTRDYTQKEMAAAGPNVIGGMVHGVEPGDVSRVIDNENARMRQDKYREMLTPGSGANLQDLTKAGIAAGDSSSNISALKGMFDTKETMGQRETESARSTKFQYDQLDKNLDYNTKVLASRDAQFAKTLEEQKQEFLATHSRLLSNDAQAAEQYKQAFEFAKTKDERDAILRSEIAHSTMTDPLIGERKQIDTVSRVNRAPFDLMDPVSYAEQRANDTTQAAIDLAPIQSKYNFDIEQGKLGLSRQQLLAAQQANAQRRADDLGKFDVNAGLKKYEIDGRLSQGAEQNALRQHIADRNFELGQGRIEAQRSRAESQAAHQQMVDQRAGEQVAAKDLQSMLQGQYKDQTAKKYMELSQLLGTLSSDVKQGGFEPWLARMRPEDRAQVATAYTKAQQAAEAKSDKWYKWFGAVPYEDALKEEFLKYFPKMQAQTPQAALPIPYR